MPELPEVETVARQLAPCATGRVVRGLRLFDPRLRRETPPRLPGRTVVGVSRSGKQVLIELSPRPGRRDPLWLAVHLRMTGRLIWNGDGARMPREHLRARIVFDRGALLFYDTRRFGTWSWHRSERSTRPAGVEPLSPALTANRFAALVGKSRQNVKAWLLRQDRLVGLGNIYASEILFAAGVSPLRSTESLSREECGRIFRATRRILRRAIRNCGTTFSDFQDARGVTGSYQRFLAVYERAGEACRRCGAPVERVVQQQRSTFYCPGCQS
jgi:formamidopyrimidine-DNA glycosylase